MRLGQSESLHIERNELTRARSLSSSNARHGALERHAGVSRSCATPRPSFLLACGSGRNRRDRGREACPRAERSQCYGSMRRGRRGHSKVLLSPEAFSCRKLSHVSRRGERGRTRAIVEGLESRLPRVVGVGYRRDLRTIASSKAQRTRFLLLKNLREWSSDVSTSCSGGESSQTGRILCYACWTRHEHQGV